MAEYISKIILTVDAKDLDDIILTFTENQNAALTDVETMNREGVVRGFKTKSLKFSGTMEVEELDDPNLPDWDAIIRDRKKLTVVKELPSGKKIKFSELRVEAIADSYSDGSSKRTLTWRARRRRPG